MKFEDYSYTLSDLSDRSKKIIKPIEDLSEKIKVLKTILGIIDLTTLSGNDTNEKVKNLSKQAIDFENSEIGTPKNAAVCVYPVFAGIVSNTLRGTGINTACVAGAFPSGQSPLEIRKLEVKYAIENGADEIDMVISRGKMIEGNIDYVYREVREIKETCRDKHLKVILETGELEKVDLIRKASEISILAGGDFLKTSTGKVSPAATPEAFLIMLDSIKEYFEKTGKKIGIKPAGGISTPDDAIAYYQLTKAVLGDQWLNKDLFRIGASRLATNIYNEIIVLTTV